MDIDLMKNKDSLIEAYEKVIDDFDETDWVLFGYEGQTPALKVVEIGNGGVESLIDELSSGKVLYAYCRIRDSNTGLYKFVLIHWTGEDVPENLKLKFTSHLKDVQNFLKRVHITVPARCEEDVDKDDIAKKVAKSSGANYSYHKEKAKPVEPSGPVGTRYEKIFATQELSNVDRDQFWTKTEKDEQARQEREKAKLEEQRKRAEAERIAREVRETKEREKRIAEHARNVNRQRRAIRQAEEDEIEAERQKWEESQKENSIQEEEYARRCDQIRKERANELAQLASSSAAFARDFFKQKCIERHHTNARADVSCVREINDGFCCKHEEEVLPSLEELNLVLAEDEKQRIEDSRPHLEPEQKCETEPEQASISEELSTKESESPSAESYALLDNIPDLLLDSLLLESNSDAQSDTEDWKELPADSFEIKEEQAPHQNAIDKSEPHNGDICFLSMSCVKTIEDLIIEKAPQKTMLVADIEADQGLCARALYDYQAADDTEISFDPEDIITNIEQIDEGWWQGFGPDGLYGMFPANYVELLQ